MTAGGGLGTWVLHVREWIGAWTPVLLFLSLVVVYLMMSTTYHEYRKNRKK